MFSDFLGFFCERATFENMLKLQKFEYRCVNYSMKSLDSFLFLLIKEDHFKTIRVEHR